MKKEKQKEKQHFVGRSGYRENIEAVLVAVLLALFIRTFIVQAFKIPSGSMKETLQVGDHILVNKFIYGVKIPFLQKNIIPIRDPKREDIVVFKYPQDPAKDFIKRVIGVAGDEIEIRNKKLFVNKEPFDRSYAVYSPRIPSPFHKGDNFGPVKVPPNKLFVMGDNRDNSHDSRFWGFVDLKTIKGKAFVIYFSWNSGGSGLKKVRWGRLFQLLE